MNSYFRYVAPLQNQSASKATGVWGRKSKLETKISDVVIPWRMGEMFDHFYQFGLGPNLIYSLRGGADRSSERLEFGCQKTQ